MWYNANGGSPSADICWNPQAAPFCPTAGLYTAVTGSGSFNAATGHDGNSLLADALFIYPAWVDFRLSPTSPAVDAANASVSGFPARDRLGLRRYDEPATSNTGTGSPAYADMGALEAFNWSFETDTSGWAAYCSGCSASIARVQSCGGSCQHGSSALEITGPNSTASFGVNDSTDWIAATPAAGITYTFSAYVRSASSTGTAKLRVREYLSGVQQGSTTYSDGVTLSSSWQKLTVTYTTVAAGSNLDFQVLDHVPSANGEVFQVDSVRIRLVYP
jgi:hypothetical protein